MLRSGELRNSAPGKASLPLSRLLRSIANANCDDGDERRGAGGVGGGTDIAVSRPRGGSAGTIGHRPSGSGSSLVSVLLLCFSTSPLPSQSTRAPFRAASISESPTRRRPEVSKSREILTPTPLIRKMASTCRVATLALQVSPPPPPVTAPQKQTPKHALVLSQASA